MDKKKGTTGAGRKSKSSRGARGANPKAQINWIEPHINEQDIAWLEGNRDNLAVYVADVLGELPEGYVFTIRYNSFIDRWQCQIMCFADDDPNNGAALVARGSTPINAAFTMSYLVGIKLEPVWTRTGRAGEVGDFG